MPCKESVKLLAKAESTNGMTSLRFILMTSQVTVVDSPAEVLSSCDTYKIESGIARADHHRCHQGKGG